MMRRLKTLTTLGLLFALLSPAVLDAQAASDSTVTATLPPELDRVLRDYERHWKAGDAAALAQLFAVDGFVLQNGRAPARGRATIQATYAPQASGDLRLRAYAFATADTTGWIIGGYRYGDTPADGGKFTLTLRRQRGGPWQIFSDMDNSIRRPPQ